MKRAVSLLTAALLVFSLGACGKAPAPTEVLDQTLQAIKAQDQEKLAAYYDGDISDIKVTPEDGEDTFSKELTKDLEEKFLAFTYKLENEKIDGDKATVDATVTTYPFGEIFTKVFSEFLAEALSLAFSSSGEPDDAAMNAKMEEITSKNLKEAKADYVKTVTVHLTKTDKGWIVDEEGNDDLFDALTGGLASIGAEDGNMDDEEGGADAPDPDIADDADDSEKDMN